MMVLTRAMNAPMTRKACLGADRRFLETSVVPGIGGLHHPAGGVQDRDRNTPGRVRASSPGSSSSWRVALES
jgi:hypothetical protein